MNFKEELKDRVDHIEAILKEYLPKEEGWQKTVIAAMNYSVLAGGKRLRPMLMEETYRLFGGKGREIEPFMAAIEMIHTYSLIHDDLPCMDNNAMRRGRPSNHMVFGESGAMMTVSGRQIADVIGDQVIRELGATSQARPVTTLSAIAFRLITVMRSRSGEPLPRLLNGAEQDALLRSCGSCAGGGSMRHVLVAARILRQG